MPETKSTHKAEVLYIDELGTIEGADKIGVAMAWGFPCVVRKEDFEKNTNHLWVYIQPDSMVPLEMKQFAFLDTKKAGGYGRITVRKYRGQKSFGLLLTAPKGAKVGDDLAEKWGILHYEPAAKGEPTPPKCGFNNRLLRKIARLSAQYGDKPPKMAVPYYDIEALRRYPDTFSNIDVVAVTEKIHGANSCYLWEDRGPWFVPLWNFRRWLVNKVMVFRKPVPCLHPDARFLRARSRQVWQQPTVNNAWMKACPPGVIQFLRERKGHVVFGELYGPSVQKLHYGEPEPKILVFDILGPGNTGWLQWNDVRWLGVYFKFDTVHELYYGLYDFNKIAAMADGNTTLNGGPHTREGIVVKSAIEKRHPRLGRMILKMVGFEYYEKQLEEGKTEV